MSSTNVVDLNVRRALVALAELTATIVQPRSKSHLRNKLYDALVTTYGISPGIAEEALNTFFTNGETDGNTGTAG